MEITVDFPGGTRVDAHFGSFVVRSDQPVGAGGENSAPSPFELFLASLATCAGFYVLGFCRTRGVSTDGIRLIQKLERNPGTKLVAKVLLEIQLPAAFPKIDMPHGPWLDSWQQKAYSGESSEFRSTA